MDRDKLTKALINHLFWGQTTDYNTKRFETTENIETVSVAINIACQQLPVRLHNEHSIYQRCVELFRMGAYHFYSHWC